MPEAKSRSRFRGARWPSRSCTLALAVLLLATAAAQAQWLPQGSPVCVAPGTQLQYPFSQPLVPDGAGGFFVTWFDERLGNNSGDVYLQRMTGQGTPLWTANGVRICDAPGQQTPYGGLTPDNSHGVYDLWSDYGTDPLGDIYLQNITADGATASGWPHEGLPVASGPAKQISRSLVADDASGVFVVWEDAPEQGGVATVYLQHITSSGVISAGWPAGGLALINFLAPEAYPALAADGAGGVVVVWTDGRSEPYPGGDIYAQRVDGDGATLWPSGGKPVCTAAAMQYGPRIVADGVGTFFITWDWGTGEPDIYLQRLTLAGDPAAGWDPNGMPACTSPYYQGNPHLALDGAGGVYVAWDDHRNFDGYPSHVGDIFLQRLGDDGTPSPGWPFDGLEITLGCTQDAPTLTVDGTGAALLAWRDQRCSGPTGIYAQRILPNGAVAPGWAAGGIPIATGPSGYKIQPSIAALNADEAVVAWNDSRDDSYDIYAQRVRFSDGAVGDHGVWSRMLPADGVPSMRSEHTAVYDAARNRIVVFGGRDDPVHFNDVWALTLSNPSWWAQLSPGGTPPTARYAHSAVYDPIRDRLLAFGGGPSNSNDVFELSLTGDGTWTELHPAGTPPIGRAGHTAIYDPVRDRMLVFGGFDGTYPPYFRNDVWALSLSGVPAWSEIIPAGFLPPIRNEHAAIYDPVRDQMVVYGGQDGTSPYRNDLWALSLSGTPSWNQIAAGGSPPPGLAAPTAIYDVVRDRMVLFGGFDGAYRNTAWALTLAGSPSWEELSPVGEAPPSRLDHAAIYDPMQDRMVVFGGRDGVSPYLNDVWALSWGTPAPPPAAPSNLVATTSDCGTTIDLAWADNSNDEVGFEVQWKVAGQPDATYARLAFLPANAAQFSHQPGDGLQYTYRVRAYRDGLFSAFSNEATSPAPGTPPPVPTGLTVTNLGTSTSLKLNWNTVPGATSYAIGRSDGSSTVPLTATSPPYEDTDLTRNTTYTYTVAAVNACGVSAFSGPVSRAPDYYPVLLVHGYCSDHLKTFTDCPDVFPCANNPGNKLGDRLYGLGLQRLFYLDYDTNDPIDADAELLRQRVDAVRSATGDPKVALVCHSMGGLVARYMLQDPTYAQETSALIMVGTPNHGTDWARRPGPGATALLQKRLLLKYLPCLLTSRARPQLAPGSSFLNRLNYGSQTSKYDTPALCPERQRESAPPPGPTLWLFHGTSGWCDRSESGFVLKWITTGLGLCEPNDGVVETGALTDGDLIGLSPDHKWSDRTLPIERHAAHFSGSAGTCFIEEMQHDLVADGVFRAITEGALAAVEQREIASTSEPGAEVAQDGSSGSLALVRRLIGRVQAGTMSQDSVILAEQDSVTIVQVADVGALGFVLKSPSGRRITFPQGADPDVSFDSDLELGYQLVRLRQPEEGWWTVETAASAEQTTDYNIDVYATSDTSLWIGPSPRETTGSLPEFMLASLQGPGGPVNGTTLVGEWSTVGGERGQLFFLDDGVHRDGAVGDGVFGATLPSQGEVEPLTVSVLATQASSALQRQAVIAVEPEAVADLAVQAEDIAIRRLSADSLRATAIVRNLGTGDNFGAAIVMAHVGSPPFYRQPIALAAGESVSFSSAFIPGPESPDTIIVYVDRSVPTFQSRYDNDSVAVIFDPGALSVAPVATERLYLAPPSPNPAHGTVIFEFFLPRAVEVQLSVFDVAGRRIATPRSGFLPQGLNRAVWNTAQPSARPISPGVYFCVLRADGERQIRRVIIIR